MLSDERSKEIAAAVLEAAKKAGADEAEVHLSGGRSALTRFAGNEVHQNVEASVLGVSLRAALGKRTARTSTTRTDAEGLRALAARTIEVARLAPEDAQLLPVLDPKEAGDAPNTRAVDEETEACTPERRAALVRAALETVVKGGAELTAAGYLSTDRGEHGTFAYANSRGLFRSFHRTTAAFSLTVDAGDATGWAEARSPRLAAVDVPALAARAASKATAARAPRDVEPGAWDVILEPAAVQSLTEFLGWGGFSARAYTDGDTWSAGLLGKKLFGENVTLRDDWSDARNPGPSWDEEGLARSRLMLVEKGVLAGLGWDRRTARRAGTTPTGHGHRVPSLWGGGPEHVVVDGGTTTLEQMIASTERGILVTRFWYNRLVDPKQVIVTGMTRDGTFLVEKGKIVCGVKNMRFNEGVIAMLNRVEALSPVDPSFLAPAMKVKGFTFSSKTKF